MAGKREKGATIGFVPTMGALHEGHLSLIEASKTNCDYTVCSIFVNPSQFNNPKDLLKYPRTEQKDIDLLVKVGCDIAFIPNVDEVYPDNHKSIKVNLGGLELVMEGEHRPGHFDGVVEVVWRFFEQMEPDNAYFGEKDFQQLAVIKRMVSEMNSPINIVPCPILRENSGLAMSSRNVRLSKEGLQASIYLSRQLMWAKNNYGKLNVDEIIETVITRINKHDSFTLEYFEIADSEFLQPVKDATILARAFIVAEIEGVRLIDNMALSY